LVLALALGYQSLALALPLGLSVFGIGLKVVLDIGLEHSNFLATNPAPVSILTSVKKYLDFIPEQSCSAGSVDSWKAVQQKADFQVLHHLLEKVLCSTAISALVERVFSTFPEREIGCSQILYC